MPRRRRLAQLLIPKLDFSCREPQQFGMISFTALDALQAVEHREKYGHLALWFLISGQCRRERGALAMLKTRGPLPHRCKRLFAVGYDDVVRRIRRQDDGAWRLAHGAWRLAHGLREQAFSEVSS